MKTLAAQDLCKTCDPKTFGFRSTEDLAPFDGFLGQERALDAIRLSSEIPHRDFNLFVLGPTGTGRHAAVQKILSERAATCEAPSDWAYVNNFEAPDRPKALRMPTGTAVRLRHAMEALVDDLANEIPALFDSEEYQAQRRGIEEELGEVQEARMADFADRAKSEDVALLRAPTGFMLTAIIDGKALKREDFEKLDETRQAEIDEKISRLQDDLAAVFRDAPKLEKEARKRIESLNAKMAERAVSARIAEVAPDLSAIEAVASHLEAVHADIIDNADVFLAAAAEKNEGPFPGAIRKFHQEPEFGRYSVNVMVSHGGETEHGAPMETEDLPTLGRLTGRIEHVSQMGSLVTNFTMIKPGALHVANGGYLILDVRRVLSEPYAWDALKRCLKNRSISITSLAERLSLVSTTSLQPDPIPLDVRVVLVGDRLLHALLTMFDPDFGELFKLEADFSDEVDRDEASLALFARIIGAYARREKLKPISADGIARLLDEATRLAGDSKKLSLRLGALADILREADHYAGGRGSDLTTAADIETAIGEKERRAARIKERMQEAIARRTVLIDTEGAKVGQVNGLSVVVLGDTAFGRPSRITARVRMGTGKLIDIEREVELGGPLHSKGVMILAGYLAATYAHDVPFSLHASLVFEQSYGGVDGDSASSAELYALLSALSGLPIAQGFAVTGSVNQLGEVQAIGGVNEKIEGFFDVCVGRGLTGDQGVLIPQANVEHLMLRRPVVEAVEAGKFRVIPVTTISEGIETLTGTDAGARRADGTFTEGSVNERVETRLRVFAETRRVFARSRPGETGEGGEGDT